MNFPGSGIERIVSGGQTGVDRGALDAALDHGLPHGGWCPLGRLAEDGPIPERYELRETESADYTVRTERNVIDSDGTLIIYRGSLSGGTERTWRLAIRHKRPYLLVDLKSPPEIAYIRRWITENEVHVLNVAGPRESTEPGIGEQARQLLAAVLSVAG